MVRNTYKYNILRCLLYFFVFFLNQIFANKIELFNVAPNLIFVFVLCDSLSESRTSNIYFALVSGIFFDFFNGKIMGVYTVLFVVISFVASEFYHNYFENMTSVKILFAVLSSLFYSLIQAIFFGLRGTSFISLLTGVSLIEFVYNSVIAIIVTLIFNRVAEIKPSAWRI